MSTHPQQYPRASDVSSAPATRYRHLRRSSTPSRPQSPASLQEDAPSSDRAVVSFRNFWRPQHLSRRRRSLALLNNDINDDNNNSNNNDNNNHQSVAVEVEELEAYYLNDAASVPRKLPVVDQHQLRALRDAGAGAGVADQFLALTPAQRNAVERAVRMAGRYDFREKTCAGIHVREANGQSEPSLVVFLSVGDPVEPVRLRCGMALFRFPFDLCRTWEGMRAFLEEAFRSDPVLLRALRTGTYDLVSPDNEIILPRAWEKIARPAWDLTFVPTAPPHRQLCAHGHLRPEYADSETSVETSVLSSARPRAGSPPLNPAAYPLPESSWGEDDGGNRSAGGDSVVTKFESTVSHAEGSRGRRPGRPMDYHGGHWRDA
ncbi:hypothetical protein F4810DRAFT_723700 [Camillea tinctor]|nr:hypothetical protein F4810DRAFT_723700 [Camillea tinctor]